MVDQKLFRERLVPGDHKPPGIASRVGYAHELQVGDHILIVEGNADGTAMSMGGQPIGFVEITVKAYYRKRTGV